MLNTIHRDMKMIRCSRMWPLTSYSPYPHLKSIPGDMSDISCEELRYLRYTSSEDEYVEYEKLLGEDYQQMRLRLERHKFSDESDDVCILADDIMMYLVKEVYISKDEDARASYLKLSQDILCKVLLCCNTVTAWLAAIRGILFICKGAGRPLGPYYGLLC